MIKEVYSIFDSAVEAFEGPMLFHREGDALRTFGRLCQDRNFPYHASLKDYSLFRLGKFDDKDASFDMLKAPERVALALQFKEPAQNELSSEPTVAAPVFPSSVRSNSKKQVRSQPRN